MQIWLKHAVPELFGDPDDIHVLRVGALYQAPVLLPVQNKGKLYIK